MEIGGVGDRDLTATSLVTVIPLAFTMSSTTSHWGISLECMMYNFASGFLSEIYDVTIPPKTLYTSFMNELEWLPS